MAIQLTAGGFYDAYDVRFTSQRKVVSTSDGKLVAFYIGLDSGDGDVDCIGYQVSSDGGATWGSYTPVINANDTNFGKQFTVEIDSSDTIYILLSSTAETYLTSVKLTYSGGAWTIGSFVTVNSWVNSTYVLPSLCIRSNGDIYAACRRGSTTSVNFGSWYSTDGGATWTLIADLTSTGYGIRTLKLVAVGTTVNLYVNANARIREMVYDSSWSSPTTIYTGADVSYNNGNIGVAATSASDIWIIFSKSAGTIYYTHYDGASWSTPASISDYTDDQQPDVTLVNGAPIATWKQVTAPISLQYRRWNGSSWDAKASLIENDDYYYATLLKSHPSNLVGLYSLDTVTPELYFFSQSMTPPVQQTITSDATIAGAPPIQETITSDAKVVLQGADTIVADSKVRGVVDFIGKAGVKATEAVDYFAELAISSVTALNPVNLQATDLKLGDSVELTWNSSSNYGFNIYKDVGGVWVLLNQVPVTGTFYVAGALVTGVTYTFKVVGVNGQGIESSGVTITGKPTFDITRYSGPIYTIHVGGVLQNEAILESVENVYGPQFSTAKWKINKRPDDVSLPVPARQEVIVTINGRRVFTGYLTRRENRWSSQDISVSYTALSKCWQYTFKTCSATSFDYERLAGSGLVGYNYMLAGLGLPTGLPQQLIPEKIDSRDMTQLELMSAFCRMTGNWNIYTDPYGVTSYYQYGKPVTQRTYTVGVNIIDWNDVYDLSSKVDQVIAYSGKKIITNSNYGGQVGAVLMKDASPEVQQQILAGSDYPKAVEQDWTKQRGHVLDSSGNVYYITEIQSSGKITGVNAFTESNQPPEVARIATRKTKDQNGNDVWSPVEVCPGHAFGSPMYDLTDGSRPLTVRWTWVNGGTEARPAISSYYEYPSQWGSASVEIEYLNKEQTHAVIKVACGKVFKKRLVAGNATFWRVNPTTNAAEAQELSFMVMEEPWEYAGAVSYFFSFEQSAMSYSVGSAGTVVRTLHDEALKPYDVDVQSRGLTKSVTESNLTESASYLMQRASELLAQSKEVDREGSLTVLGDETIDLRTQINGMEVVRVIHSFSNGFLTTVDLTVPQKLFGTVVLKDKQFDNTFSNFKKLEKILWTITGSALSIPNSVRTFNGEVGASAFGGPSAFAPVPEKPAPTPPVPPTGTTKTGTAHYAD